MNEKNEMTENEKKKDFLYSYKRAKMGLIRLEEQLKELRFNKISPSAIYDGLPHGSNTSDLSDYAAKVDEIDCDINKARYKRICTFQKVREKIEAMEDEREKDLLTYRYLSLMEWEKIAVKMSLSYRHTIRLHGKALKNFKMS